MPYAIQYAQEVGDHLAALTARERSVVFDAVVEQLAHEPNVETRNRKPMRPNSIAPWELRVWDLRVYFSAEHEPEQIVTVLAVGKKSHNRVVIGNEEVEL